jgi:hypothetical protein
MGCKNSRSFLPEPPPFRLLGLSLNGDELLPWE